MTIVVLLSATSMTAQVVVDDSRWEIKALATPCYLFTWMRIAIADGVGQESARAVYW